MFVIEVTQREFNVLMRLLLENEGNRDDEVSLELYLKLKSGKSSKYIPDEPDFSKVDYTQIAGWLT